MSAPRMTQRQYDEYLRKRYNESSVVKPHDRIAQKAAGAPRPALRMQKGCKWSAPERRYFYGVLGGVGAYEGATLRITPAECEKHEYTPDFVTEHEESVSLCGHDFRNMMRVCHEVKGNYRLGSQDGARLRWCFAAVAHPADIFVWAKESKRRGLWDIEVWYDGGRTRLRKRAVAGFDFDGKGGVTWRTA